MKLLYYFVFLLVLSFIVTYPLNFFKRDGVLGIQSDIITEQDKDVSLLIFDKNQHQILQKTFSSKSVDYDFILELEHKYTIVFFAQKNIELDKLKVITPSSLNVHIENINTLDLDFDYELHYFDLLSTETGDNKQNLGSFVVKFLL